jgi:cysteine desulfurase
MSFGKIPINFEAWGITYLTISGHKFYAPKGVGALNEFFYERKLP